MLQRSPCFDTRYVTAQHPSKQIAKQNGLHNMKEANMKPRICKTAWKPVCVLLVLLMPLIWLVAIPSASGQKIAKEIDYALSSRQPIMTKNLVSEAETLCVLPPYSSPASIKNHLSEKQLSHLERRINTFIGLNDRIWWLIALKQNGTVDAYRMAASARPHFKSGKCLENTNAFITFDHGNGHYLFFNFSAGA